MSAEIPGARECVRLRTKRLMSYPIKGDFIAYTRRAEPETSGGRMHKILGCDRHPFLVLGLYVSFRNARAVFKRPMRARLVQGYRHPRSTRGDLFPTRSANGFSANFPDRRGQS
jgi:hypothetical protein